MSYTTTHLTTLGQLKSLAEKAEATYAKETDLSTLESTVTSLSDSIPTAIAAAISASGHAAFEIAESVPSADEAESNILYLVANAETGYYDIYALISGEVVLLDDTTVDLTDYVTSESLATVLADYVTSSVLTTTLADYVLSSEIATDDEVTEMLEEIYG